MLGYFHSVAYVRDVVVRNRFSIVRRGSETPAEIAVLNRFLRRAFHTRGGRYVTPLDLVARRPQFE